MHQSGLVPAFQHEYSRWLRFAVVAIGLFGSTFALSSQVQAQNAGKWAEVGGWEVRVDPSVGNGCFAIQLYEDGTVVRIGVDVDQKRIYLFFGNNSWKSLELGKIYPVRITFDGVSNYNGEMNGYRLAGGTMVLAHRNLSSDFVKDFMQRNGMRLYYQGNQIANLSLRNTIAKRNSDSDRVPPASPILSHQVAADDLTPTRFARLKARSAANG
jgi:hypothetical protein